MARIDRMFELVQELRRAQRPLTGRDLAERLEVSVRTVYRDCAALQAMGIPIEGEAGIGYVMRRGYDLPPLAFTEGEREAMLVALRMLGRIGDVALLKAADGAISKLVVAAQVSEAVHDVKIFVSQAGAPSASIQIVETVRAAIDAETKLNVVYEDRGGRSSERRIWPLCFVFYPDASVIAAWCELRADFRHFRIDWLQQVVPTQLPFERRGLDLRREWQEREGWEADHPGAIGRALAAPS